MQNKIDIFIFNKTKICSNIHHKISFNDNNDIYNPFNMKNVALSASFDQNKCIDIIDIAYKFAINSDLKKIANLKNDSIAVLESQMTCIMKPFLYEFIFNSSDYLINKNIPYNCACMKMMLELKSSQMFHVLFHAFMTKHMMKLLFYNMSVVDAYVDDLFKTE